MQGTRRLRISSLLLLGFWVPLLAHMVLLSGGKQQLLVLWLISVSMVTASMLLSWLEARKDAEGATAGPKFLLADMALLWLLGIGFHDGVIPRPSAFGLDLWLVLPFAITLGLFYLYVPLIWKPRDVSSQGTAVAAGMGIVFLASMASYQVAATSRPSLTVALALLGMAMALNHLALSPPEPGKVGKAMSAVSAAFAASAAASVLLGTPFWGLFSCAFGAPCSISGLVRRNDTRSRLVAACSLVVLAAWFFLWLFSWGGHRAPPI